jgi:hypothetical protein
MRSGLVAVGLAVAAAGSSMLAPLIAGASDEPIVRVEYDHPHVSVAATEVGLGDLLRLIGAKVGFSVAEGRAALGRVTVSIASASVDDVLRQLLRAENHTILYRQGADAIAMVDRIVLLGAPAEGVSVAETGPRPSQEPQVVSAVPVSSGAGESATTGEPQAPVGDMLQSHALAGLRPPPETIAEPAAPSTPASPEERLAITTQRAQPGLTSLVEGQDRATRALPQPAPASATGR